MSDDIDGYFGSAPPPVRQALPMQAQCGVCGLYKQCKSPKMPVYGKGRKGILIVGEAPGCISGDSLIDTAFRDKSKHPCGIPIQDLVSLSGFYVYSFSVKQQKLVLGKVRKVWKTGRKKVYRVTYEWSYADGEVKVVRRDSILATANHKFLLKRRIKHDPFGGLQRDTDYLSIDDGLQVGDALQPFLRHNRDYSFVGASAKGVVKESRFLLSFKLGRKLDNRFKHRAAEECHHRDENKLNDSWSNLELQTTASHAKHHTDKINPMDRPGVREKHRRAVDDPNYRKNLSVAMKAHLADPKAYRRRCKQIQKQREQTSVTVRTRFATDPAYYYRYLVGQFAVRRTKQGKGGLAEPEGWVERRFKSRFPNEDFPPHDNHRIISIEYVGVRDVYDMDVEKYHNFAVNGVFVHNSDEDCQGRPFVGASGSELKQTIAEFGIELDYDCWRTNAIICRPHDGPRNRTPTAAEIGYCRPNIVRTIAELNPKTIILLGQAACQSVIGWLWKDSVGPIGRWIGWRIPCQKINAWICPAWHPSYILRGESNDDQEDRGKDNPVRELIWKEHLKAALAKKHRPWKTVPDYRSQIRVIMEPDEAAKEIRIMMAFASEHKPIAFDYETTTLKPDGPHAEIYTCSMANGEYAISYPWHGKAITATREFLRSRIPKIASNKKFEDRWTRKDSGFPVENWVFDTMLAAHVLDNRRDINSIKFQGWALLGQDIWNDAVEPYLKSPGSNTPNKIKETDLYSVLFYNALD